MHMVSGTCYGKPVSDTETRYLIPAGKRVPDASVHSTRLVPDQYLLATWSRIAGNS